MITAAPILATLAQVAGDGQVDVAGAWTRRSSRTSTAVVGDRGLGVEDARCSRRSLGAAFSGKSSTPWAPGTLHDYMHAKVTVADDVVFRGSFNLSRSGEQNAENVLEIHDPALASGWPGSWTTCGLAIRSRA